VRAAGYWDRFVRMLDACARTRGFGDYYGYNLVAAGKAELYLETDLKPWDAAPMKILVEEAGGRLTDFTGTPTIYGGSVLATNGRLHDLALRALAG
jgi:histidinol-phosphatase